jgi:molecular chaperone HscA
VFQVLATGGNALLGGDDIDRLLSQSLFAGQAIELKKLLQLRSLKELLSREDSVVSNGVTVTRRDLDKLAQPLINETLKVFKRAVKDADIDIASIKEVILVGGATQMPLIHKEVTVLTGKPPLADINPEEIVAIGAALQAEALVSGSNNLLIDVIPLSLGIEVGDGIVECIIPRNSSIPTARSQKFATQKPNQTGIVIHVVQGEGAKVRDCRSLARFELKGIPPLPAGQAKVEVRFQIDADGLLLVSAQELTTGLMQDIMVKPSYGLTESEILELLR